MLSRERGVNRLLMERSRIEVQLRRYGPEPVLFALEPADPEPPRGLASESSGPGTQSQSSSLISEAVRCGKGTLLEIGGNVVLAVFPSPRQAVDAAAEIQRDLQGRDPSGRPDSGPAVRIGIAWRTAPLPGVPAGGASVLQDVADLLGRAHGSQILVSPAVAREMGEQGIRCSPVEEAKAEEAGRDDGVFRVHWEEPGPRRGARTPERAPAATQMLEAPETRAKALIAGISEPVPDRIGAYRILEVLGKGGMGVVYLAEQDRPIRRRVALKLVQPDVDSRDVLARFEAERQALAMLDHPSIAKVFDAGTSERGRPYFVMEYVDGMPFRDYCDQNSLTLRERLELFLPVCEALHHAHLKGIVHRDVKPSNVLVSLVDGKPLPKLIDFGLAKATQVRLTERNPRTRFGQILGTPSYMSPEQAGLTEAGIDSASDIYSLGVMLYELLTGTLPFDPERLMEKGYSELQRVIREVDPPKPSLRLLAGGAVAEAVGKKRRTDQDSLRRMVRGDLDRIAMRAMEKDRSRRYPTAAMLAEDIRRHLCHEPILARPPSLSYRLGKMVRRKPMHAALAGVLAVLLPVGGWIEYRSLGQQRRLKAIQVGQLERDLLRAGNEPTKLAKVSGKLLRLDPGNVKGLRGLAVASFNRSLHQDPSSPEWMESRRQALEGADQLIQALPELSSPVLMKAHFLETYGDRVQADALRKRAPRPIHPTTDDLYFQARAIVDGAHPSDGELEEAEKLLTQALLLDERFDTVELRGQVRQMLGKKDDALDDFRILTLREPTDFYPQLEMGGVLIEKKKFEEADDHLQRALDLAPRAKKAEIYNRRAYNFIQWSEALDAKGDRPGALQRARDAEAAARAGLKLAPDEPQLHINLATSLRNQHQFSPNGRRDLIDAAVLEFEKARPLAQLSGKKEEQREADKAFAGICDAYLQINDARTAMPYCRQGAEILSNDPVAFYNLAGALALSGRKDEALAALEKDFQLGDNDFNWLRDDPWFRSLREDPRFKKLLKEMAARAAQKNGR